MGVNAQRVGDGEVAALAERFRTRLRLPHVLVMALAALIVVIGLGGLVEVWDPHLPSKDRIGDPATRTQWSILFGAVYVTGAALLGYGLARFDTRTMLRRLPLTLLLSLLLVVAVAAGSLIGSALSNSGSGGGGDGSDSTRSDGDSDATRRSARAGKRVNQSLAYALLDQSVVARILGEPVAPVPHVSSLSLGRNVCRYRTEAGRLLAVSVCEAARAAKRYRRIAPRAEPLPDLGDRALRFSDQAAGGRVAIAVQQGPWFVDLTVVRTGSERAFVESALVELARTAIGRLTSATG